MNKEKVFEFMEKGFNCSQTVFCYFSKQYGLDEEVAKKIAAPFESGMFQGENCGAVSGAYMVIGLAYSKENRQESRAILEKKVQEFNRAFKEQQRGTLLCKEILGMDLSKPNGLEEALEKGIIQEKCPCAILSAIDVLEKVIL